MANKNQLYQRKILKQLYFGSLLSCLDISRLLGKSIPLTTKMLGEMVDNGVVSETGFAQSTGGRRPLMYAIRSGVLYVVAVAMDQFITRIVIMDLQNRYVTPVEKYELPLKKNEEALSILIDRIGEVIQRSGIEKSRIAGIGIGTPGFVDVKKGVNYSYLANDGNSIVETIGKKLALPVYIDNDSSLIALAELRFGSARKAKNAAVINISWGIGLGLILNGELFTGHNGFAGEFSHIPLFVNNKLCDCGKSGCLETEASLLVVVEKAIERLKEGRVSLLKNLDIEHCEQGCEAIIAAAVKGDKFAVELLSEAGYTIGRGAAILIHLLNPEMVIFSGRGSAAGKLWKAPIQQALHEYCIPRLASDTVIEISQLGYDAELIGAATLVMENYDREISRKEALSFHGLDAQPN